MIKVTWVLNNGARISADVSIGQSLMEAAIENNVPNIDGDCRGCLSCATCHVIIDQAWYHSVGTPNEIENEMLDLVPNGRNPFSRLSCQIDVDQDIDGLTVYVP